MSEMILRPVRGEDVPAMRAIYAQYINTTVTFEYTLPDEAEFLRRVREVTETYPWLVGEAEERVIGYAYAHRYKERAAYAWDVELSVYTHRDCAGQGVGRRLYGALLALLALQGVYNAYARVTCPNEKSARLHQSMGFVKVGEEHGTGYKNGVWRDLFVYEKSRSPRDGAPAPVVPLCALDPAEVAAVLQRYG